MHIGWWAIYVKHKGKIFEEMKGTNKGKWKRFLERINFKKCNDILTGKCHSDGNLFMC